MKRVLYLSPLICCFLVSCSGNDGDDVPVFAIALLTVSASCLLFFIARNFGRSARMGILLCFAFYFSSLWLVQHIVGSEAWWTWIVAIPTIGVLLTIWFGAKLAWEIFKDAVNTLEDERQ